MELQPHQQRVITEREELKQKHDKLIDFMKSDRINQLTQLEVNLLCLQSDIMSSYLNVLSRRIELFNK